MATDPSIPALKVKLEFDNYKEIKDQLGELYTHTTNANTAEKLEDRENLNAFFKMTNELSRMLHGLPSSEADENTRAGFALTKQASQTSDKIAGDIMKIMKTGIGIIEDIHARLKQSSPLLQSVESLFNLAVQLFFMPLGNKLATVMIPAVIDLVDDVTAMWSRFEGMDLGEMLNEMINYGAQVFGQFFQNLGESLAEQSGIAGSIGKALVGLGSFIENDLGDLIQIIADVLKFIMDNLGTLVNAFIEFKILSISLQTAQLAAAMAGDLAFIGGLVGLGIGEIGGHAVLGSTGIYDATSKMATGGYVEATEGGREIIVGEGGEGEFIIPESKLGSMMSSVGDRMVDAASAKPKSTKGPQGSAQVINNYFTINGYTDSQLRDIIRDTVNEQVSQSRLRSGF